MAASTPLSDFSDSTTLPELEALGRSLRQAREAQGVSLQVLATRLNIGGEQLEALENGDRKRLKEAVFVIAMARRIAGSLGVNVDHQIQALRANPAFSASPAQPAQPSRTSAAAAAAAAPPSNSSQGHRMRGPIAAAVVAALALAAGALALQRLPKRAPVAAPAAATAPAAKPAGAPALVLHAQGSSWVEVTTTSGDSLFRGMLEGKMSFPLGQGLRVLAGRPDLVSAQLGTGPAEVLGTIDQVQWRRFSPAPAQSR